MKPYSTWHDPIVPEQRYTFDEAHGRYRTKRGMLCLVDFKPGCIEVLGWQGRATFRSERELRAWLERN